MPDVAQFNAYARALRLTPIGEASLEFQTNQPPVVKTSKAVGWRSRGGIAFLVLVVVPVCLAAGYLWILAADRYESEARFVLRMPGNAVAAAQIANLLQSTGVTRANDDSYIVQDFLESRDAVAWLEKNTDLKAAVGGAPKDPLWRYPSVFSSNTQEGLHRYFQRMMSASFDSTTGVSTLRVQAFSPSDAQRLTSSLLDAAESLINRLNERARTDSVELAEAEKERMKERALAAQAAVTAYRERERLIDPGQVTLAVVETIAQLSLDASQLSVQISELQKTAAHAPQLASLRTRRAALEAQISTEWRRLVGDATSIAPRIAEYEGLMLERNFAERALMSSMAAVEMAKAEGRRHQVYLERVTEPGRPDHPVAPWRVIWLLGVLAGSYMAFRIWRIVAVDAVRHSER